VSEKHTITLGASDTLYEVPLMVKKFLEKQQEVFHEMRRQMNAANEALDKAYKKGFQEGKESMMVDITKL